MDKTERMELRADKDWIELRDELAAWAGLSKSKTTRQAVLFAVDNIKLFLLWLHRDEGAR